MRAVSMCAAVVAMAVAMLVPAGQASAEERVCRGTIGAATVDNLRVPQGATCTLNGTYVKGTVKVERGATLRAFGIRAVGNAEAENARNVVLRQASRVGEACRSCRAVRHGNFGSRINGDILFDDQRRALTANRNVIGGNLQAFQNTGGLEDPEQPDRRQPPVQGEPAGSGRRRQHRAGQQGGPVPASLIDRRGSPR